MTRYKGLSNFEISQMSDYERIIIHAFPQDGHLIWMGNYDNRGYPLFALTVGGKKINLGVRRYLFMKEYPEVVDPWVRNACGEDQCVLPAHQEDTRDRTARRKAGITPVRQIRSLRVTLVQNLYTGGYTPEEIAVGLKLNLATVKRIINAANK